MNAVDQIVPNQTELAVFRTPIEYLDFFDEILNATRDDRWKEEALHQRGRFKRFYEEMFPLAMLLQHKHNVDEWSDARFRHGGEDELDVEVNASCLPFRWMEITTTTYDADQEYRMSILDQKGHVSQTGEIQLDKNGRRIGIDPTATSRPQGIASERDKVMNVIQCKCKKRYVGRPALLVYFQDKDRYFQPRDYQVIRDCCEDLRPAWSAHFSHLFAVGPQNLEIVDLKP